MKVRLCAWITLLAITLTGCVETRFESPLGGRLESCDARWKGLWIGTDPTDQTAAIFVDPGCHAYVVDRPAPDKPIRRVELPLRYKQVDGQNYLSVEAAAFKDLVDLDPPYAIEPMPAHAYFFAHYQTRGDRMEIKLVNSKRVAQLIIDGKIDGTISKTANELHVFVRGDPARMLEIVRNQSIFEGVEPTMLVRSKQTLEQFERNLQHAPATRSR
jgi:hypothetical protein